MSQATIRTELQALRACLNWAVGQSLIDRAPNIKLPARPPARQRWLTRDEAARLIDACHTPHIRLFVLIALHSAARRNAILGLTWDRIDMEARRTDFLEPGREATRKRRTTVPINDTLFVELQAARERATSQAVTEWAGENVQSVRHALDRAAERAGVKDVTPHVFRHTATTWMAQAGVPLWEIAGMLGNTVEMVDQVYGHQHPDHLSRASKALG